MSAPHATFAHPGRNIDEIGVVPGSVIADLGAGSGHYALKFAARLRGTGRVYAVDVQRDLLRRLKNEAEQSGLKNLETIQGDIERLHGTHLADASVDMAIMSNVLFQLEDPPAAFKEAYRILKPSGTLVIIDWADSYGGMGPTKKHVVSEENARALAYDAGFDFVRAFEAGAHHYGLISEPTR